MEPLASILRALGIAALILDKSSNCSGEPVRIAASAGRLAEQGASGMYSFSAEAGVLASAFERQDFTGRRIEPVAASLCVSPGWEIAGVRLQAR